MKDIVLTNPKKKSFEINSASFEDMNKVLFLFLTMIGHFIGLQKIIYKGFLGWVKDIWKDLLRFTLLGLPVQLSQTSSIGNELMTALVVIVFLVFPSIEILLALFNKLKNEYNEVFVLSTMFLKSEQKKIYFDFYKKTRQKVAKEKAKVANINKLFQANYTDIFKKHKVELESSIKLKESKVIIIDNPLFVYPKLKVFNIFVSEGDLCFYPEEIIDDFNDRYSEKLYYNISRKPSHKIDYSNLDYSEIKEPPFFRIKIDSIQSVKIDGKKELVNKITGGGSSLSGALIGGLIAGDAGAIIGSRKPIESKIVEIDNREVSIIFLSNGKRKMLKFKPNIIDALEQLILDKFKY